MVKKVNKLKGLYHNDVKIMEQIIKIMFMEGFYLIYSHDQWTKSCNKWMMGLGLLFIELNNMPSNVFHVSLTFLTIWSFSNGCFGTKSLHGVILV